MIVDISFESDQRDIVVEISRVEFVMDENVRGIKFGVSVEFGVVVHIPFSQTDPKASTI